MEPPLSRRCPILLTLEKLTDWISVKGKTPPSRKLLGRVESVRQRNPPVITNQQAAPTIVYSKLLILN